MASLVAVCFAVVFLLPQPAYADTDCEDFASAQQAQDYFQSQVGDPDDLDRDGDGFACEWGPPPDDDQAFDTQETGNSRDSDAALSSGVPWWVWAGGGVALLWLLGIARMTSDS